MAIRLKHLPKEIQDRVLAQVTGPKAGRTKYGNRKVTIDGHTFDSQLEGAVYLILRSEERAGLIADMERQVTIPLVAGITYRADFRVREIASGKRFLVEAKGKETGVWRLKKKLYREFGEWELRVFGGTHKHPVEVERLVPKRLQ